MNAVFGTEHGDCTTELTTVMDTCKRSSQQDQSILQQAVLTGLESYTLECVPEVGRGHVEDKFMGNVGVGVEGR